MFLLGLALCAPAVASTRVSPVLGRWTWERKPIQPSQTFAEAYRMEFISGGRVIVTSFAFDTFSKGHGEALEDEARFRLKGGKLLYIRRNPKSTLGWPEPTGSLHEAPALYNCAVAFTADRHAMVLSRCGIAGSWVRNPKPDASADR